MNNFDNLHKEQDEFIKNTLKQDKIVSQPVLDEFTTYMENSNIKVKKYTHKQKNIFIFTIIILLLLVIVISFSLLNKPYCTSEKPITNALSSNTNNNKNRIKDEVSNNTINENNTLNITEENKVKNNNSIIVESNSNTTSTNTIVSNITQNSDDLKNLRELEELIERYSIGINRISYDNETLESNTILLLIAKEYFDSHSSKSSLKVDTTYAATLENMHKYLTELTENDYSNIPYISAYSNYIGYSNTSKTYLLGKDYNTITKEKYECSDLEITNNENGLYTAKANITRTLDKENTKYEITVTFKINKDYTYEKFNIKSLKARNTSFYNDNTVHLVNQASIVEEDEN